MNNHLRITIAYLVFGALWIFFSDSLLHLMTSDPELLRSIQTAKGWSYVCLSGGLIFVLTKRAFWLEQQREKEKREAVVNTVRVAHDILGNYLNQMTLVTLEAEECVEFDRELVTLAKRITKEAGGELRKLGEIDSEVPEKVAI
ncbi:hypothetical protein [Pelagicoccus mobilis]|uniref:Uncharacterized protein n=1 Tax=Pelagicoccus mobilis TaxID=415221 RepID=A0A934S550_9BACT|nr:hypothetical protein [Pelagicoccus mobilis]MBK1879564.1 hypothetical protein [Pelagicoccus mobilis]